MNSDRIQLLEKKIHEAVTYIVSLREENRTLHTTLKQTEDRLKELEKQLADIQSEHGSIEEGVESALKSLELLEDEITQTRQHGDTKEKNAEPTEKREDQYSIFSSEEDLPTEAVPDIDIDIPSESPSHTVDFFTSSESPEEAVTFSEPTEKDTQNPDTTPNFF